jgi:hypothetical protein
MPQPKGTVKAGILSEGIDLLPSELFITIFHLCPQTKDIDLTQVGVSSNKYVIENGPWTLSHVCRKWRSICISTPSLWSDITVTSASDALFELPPRFPMSPNSIPLIEEGLTHSKSYSLSISIKGVWTSPSMVKPFFPYCSRWKSLSLEIALLDSQAWDRALAPISGHLLNLATLKLRVAPHHVWGYDNSSTQILAFQNALHLRYVHIDINSHVAVEHDDAHPELIVKLPWSSLTDVTIISEFPEGHATRILPLASNLRFLKMEGGYGDLDMWAGMCHTGIQALDLNCPGSLRFFTLPNLKMLRITIARVPTDVEDIINFISRSKCELHSLCISTSYDARGPVARGDIVELLGVCPAVTEFTFLGRKMIDVESIISCLIGSTGNESNEADNHERGVFTFLGRKMIDVESILSCLIGSTGNESNEADNHDNTSPIHEMSDLTSNLTNSPLLPLLQILNIHFAPTMPSGSHGPFFDTNPAVLPWLNTLIASRRPGTTPSSSPGGVTAPSPGLQRIRLCTIGQEMDDHSQMVSMAYRLDAYANRSGWQFEGKGSAAGGTSVLCCQSDKWRFTASGGFLSLWECPDDCPAT